jgi:hypothetical protein
MEKNIFALDTFDKMYSIAEKFTGTKEKPNDMVPKNYQGNPSAFLIALEISQKIGETVLGVMQNLGVIQGRPAWSSKYMIGKINGSGKYHGGLRFCLSAVDEHETEVDYVEWQWSAERGKNTPLAKKCKVKNQSCYAYTYNIKTGAEIRGLTIDLVTAIKEGWYHKSGSKWQTMPSVMLQYRAASFFASFYIPELLFGVPTVEEIEDGIVYEERSPLQAPANVAVPFKRTYADIEGSLKMMKLTLRLENENGRIWAIAQGSTFPHQSDLQKLGFEMTKTSAGFLTRLDVTNISGVPLPGQQALDLKEQLSPSNITTLPELERYVLENGYGIDIAKKGEKVFAKLDINLDVQSQKDFAFGLGFSTSPRGIVRDVTELVVA